MQQARFAIFPRHRELLERDAAILDAAREILIESGYYGLTMDRVALKSNLPKGTVYLRFGCKEDLVLALAARAMSMRLSLMERGASFSGRTRERAAALGEAVSLFQRLHQAESRVIHTSMGPLREKASPERVTELVRLETDSIGVFAKILAEAVADGDLKLKGETSIDEIVLGTWALIEGAHVLVENAGPERSLNIHDPFHKVWRYFNSIADAYGWRPLFAEWDYEETLARVRKEIFPQEAQQLYVKDMWYGDRR